MIVKLLCGLMKDVQTAQDFLHEHTHMQNADIGLIKASEINLKYNFKHKPPQKMVTAM